jgi:hypothetical protein
MSLLWIGLILIMVGLAVVGAGYEQGRLRRKSKRKRSETTPILNGLRWGYYYLALVGFGAIVVIGARAMGLGIPTPALVLILIAGIVMVLVFKWQR